MSAKIFGGSRGRDIQDIVESLMLTSGAICNEAAMPTSYSEAEINVMSESVEQLMVEHYAGAMDERFHDMLKEDAQGVATMLKNNIRELHDQHLLTESAMPSIRTLTASIATNMRAPYECTVHRVYNTRTADKWQMEIQDVEPTIAAPGCDEESLIDAFSPYAKTHFIDKTEMPVDVLVKGVKPGNECNKLPLTPGMDPLLKVGRDARVTAIEATYKDGTKVPATAICIRRGSTPYFDVKDNVLNVDFNVTLKNSTVEVVHISGRVDFEKNILEFLSASCTDEIVVDLVKFYANVSHEEHLFPITTGVKNSFSQYIIPTRPHIEVSLPQETRTDISNGIHFFSDTDVVTYMTENISTISAGMEDERLIEGITSARMWESGFSFEAPTDFAYGNLEWFKREFVPFLDQVALKMKNEFNITDCHFRVLVSPFILRLLDADYSLDKSADENSKGSGVINYSIGVKTSTSTFYLISSQRVPDSKAYVLLQPNEFKVTPVRTYDYYRYSSFLTDKIRRSDNTRFEAIVYSERNLPLVFTPASTHLTVTDMYIENQDGKRYFRRV